VDNHKHIDKHKKNQREIMTEEEIIQERLKINRKYLDMHQTNQRENMTEE
jgi:hypothetical protein